SRSSLAFATAPSIASARRARAASHGLNRRGSRTRTSARNSAPWTKNVPSISTTGAASNIVRGSERVLRKPAGVRNNRAVATTLLLARQRRSGAQRLLYARRRVRNYFGSLREQGLAKGSLRFAARARANCLCSRRLDSSRRGPSSGADARLAGARRLGLTS